MFVCCMYCVHACYYFVSTGMFHRTQIGKDNKRLSSLRLNLIAINLNLALIFLKTYYAITKFKPRVPFNVFWRRALLSQKMVTKLKVTETLGYTHRGALPATGRLKCTSGAESKSQIECWHNKGEPDIINEVESSWYFVTGHY